MQKGGSTQRGMPSQDIKIVGEKIIDYKGEYAYGYSINQKVVYFQYRK